MNNKFITNDTKTKENFKDFCEILDIENILSYMKNNNLPSMALQVSDKGYPINLIIVKYKDDSVLFFSNLYNYYYDTTYKAWYKAKKLTKEELYKDLSADPDVDDPKFKFILGTTLNWKYFIYEGNQNDDICFGYVEGDFDEFGSIYGKQMYLDLNAYIVEGYENDLNTYMKKKERA